MSIVNFDLLISGAAATGFLIRVIESPQGRTADPVTFPLIANGDGFSYQDTPIPASLSAIPERAALSRVGQSIYAALTSDNTVQDLLSATFGAAAVSGAQVRLRFQIEADELNGLPLELLHRDPDGFLCLSPRASITRYIAGGAGETRTLYTHAPLNILLMSATPSGFAPLDVNREIAVIREALADQIAAGMVAVYETANLPLNQVRALVREKHIHVLHFIGHGAFNGGNPALALAAPDGSPVLVTAEQFAVNLAAGESLRLVVLTACESAVDSTITPLVGIAPRLIQRAGLPAVLAMQAAIRDSAAIAFTRGFYGELANGSPIDAAVREGRLCIFNLKGDSKPEFAIPVLFMRAADAQLFDFPTRQRERILRAMQDSAGDVGAAQIDSLATAYQQIADWKTLHDLLQSLDGTFELVMLAAEREDMNGAALAWTPTQTIIEQLKQFGANPKTSIATTHYTERADGALTGEGWVVETVAAAKRVNNALGLLDAKGLRRAGRDLRQTVQTYLNVSDKALEDRVAALPVWKHTDTQRTAIHEINILHTRLIEQIRLHGLLQDLLDSFRRVRDEAYSSPALWDSADIDSAWRFCRASVLDSRLRPYAESRGALTVTNEQMAGAAWAVELVAAAAQLDAALEGENAAGISAAVRDFDHTLRKHFVIADTELKDITSELQVLALQLGALLEVKR